MEQGNVQRQHLGVVDGLTNGQLGFARQANDEITPVLDARSMRPLERACGLLLAVALARLLEDRLVGALDPP